MMRLLVALAGLAGALQPPPSLSKGGTSLKFDAADAMADMIAAQHALKLESVRKAKEEVYASYAEKIAALEQELRPHGRAHLLLKCGGGAGASGARRAGPRAHVPRVPADAGLEVQADAAAREHGHEREARHRPRRAGRDLPRGPADGRAACRTSRANQ